MYTIGTGIGVWGLNKTVGWAWDITNFVWWARYWSRGYADLGGPLVVPSKVAYGHQPFCGGDDHLLGHSGRLVPLDSHGPYMDGLLGIPFPEPVLVRCGVNFNSPLLWDVFAISTYLTVSTVFWYTGLIPDFAMIRDRAINPVQKHIYRILSFGWGGKAKGVAAF